MLVSRIFGKTLRDDPAEAELYSHRLMLRSGMIYQVASGIYSYMPLAWRSLRKIEEIIREEMAAIDGQEVHLSLLQPRELWQESGRDDEYGPDMFRLEDRRGRPLVLAPTHEELLTNMVKANVNSYRDLPIIIYQIQTKFRDEPRSRGGLIRVREFDMKDAYSFDSDQSGLDNSYRSMVRAYENIYRRCGLNTIVAEADSGTIGGKDSQEFIALADAGEDTVLICESCGYAANVERATFARSIQKPVDQQLMEEVYTPEIKTIEEVAQYLDVPAHKTLKSIFYIQNGQLVFVIIRGDLQVNEVKLRNILDGAEIRLATNEEIDKAGLIAGSASAVGITNVRIIADKSINSGSNFVVGANKANYHLVNANYPRDFSVDSISDIALAQEGYSCPNCESSLIAHRGIEVGHVFKLGTRYSDVLGATFSGQDGSQHPIIMGCYGIGVGRLLAAVVEQNNDKFGMVLPASIAPYAVWLTALNVEREDVAQAAITLYETLIEAGIQVLFDDREETAGVKLKDADLLGLPVRILVSPRNLKENVVELKERSKADPTKISTECVVARVKELLAQGA